MGFDDMAMIVHICQALSRGVYVQQCDDRGAVCGKCYGGGRSGRQ
jgi:hypothetical protein